TVSAPEARILYDRYRKPLQPAVPEVALAEDSSFRGPAGTVPVRLFRAAGTHADEVLPVLVYFHGGGWTFGDLDSHDIVCRSIANQVRGALVSVAYRLAPEHKFPAALEDCIAATRWVGAEAKHLRVDASRIAVGGDSAGGNLAAVVALALRGEEPKLALQLLIYPAVDQRCDQPSHHRCAKGFLLDRDGIFWCRGNYLRDDSDIGDWRASPLLAPDHRGLAPAYIITAGFDPLLDEGAAYADKLTAAGVPVTYECFEGMVHGFITMSGALAAGNHALYRCGMMLRQAYARPN
ncbi:MAG: hypothetical protein A3I00_09785, partial [Betaproteobacteria bacterium RIFCSPLOWO2_02_FULL_64_12]